MDPTSAGLLVAVAATSTLSGALGMGGGMLLMGVYGALLPVGEALALHGVTQLMANGSRAWMLREHVRRRILLPYLAGAVLALGLFSMIRVVPPRGLLFLMLGVLALVAGRLPARWTIDEADPRTGAGCGFLVGALHLTAGVSGPLLDVWYLRAELDRRAVVATKAATQALAHTSKLVYFGAVLGFSGGSTWLTPSGVVAIWVAAIAGTWLGRRLLTRLDDGDFRNACRSLLRGVGVVYLLKALRELAF